MPEGQQDAEAANAIRRQRRHWGYDGSVGEMFGNIHRAAIWQRMVGSSSSEVLRVLGGRDLRSRCTLSCMVIPLERVRRLGDFSGQWWLSLRCRCCRHMAEIPAQKLIE